MKKYRNMSVLLVALLAVGCYKDKGNYDYRAMNDFELAFSPASTSEDGNYTVNQPVGDSTYFTLTAEVKQTLEEGDGNLSYEWIRTMTTKEDDKQVSKRDTTVEKAITLAFPPGKESEASLMCCVRDNHTDIEYRKYVTVKTKLPYMGAWLLLHGPEGDRKLGAIEIDSVGAKWTADVLATMGMEGHPDMTSITYSATGVLGENRNDDDLERLFLTSAPGESYTMTVIPCEEKYTWERMRPISNQNVKIAGEIQSNPTGCFMGFIGNDKQFYWGGREGYFYAAATREVANSPVVDKFYINREGVATLWDAANKRVMYYRVKDNDYDPWSTDRQDNINTASVKYFAGIPSGEMQDKEVLYAGRGTKAVDGNEEQTLFVVKDAAGVCYLYEFSYAGGKDDKSAKGDGKDDGKEEGGENYGTVARDTLRELAFDGETLFAATEDYNEQLFYTRGNQLFRAVLQSEESIILHSVEGTIKQIAFRYPEYTPIIDNAANKRILGIVVEKADGTDEFQEIYLNNGGDVEDVKTYRFDGLESIADIAFTHMERIMR